MSFKIGNILIKNPIVMAPMAGISNAAYIKICEEMGVGYAVTELISSEAIFRNNKKTLDMLKGIEDIKIPVGIQIFGSNPDSMEKAAKYLVSKYKNIFIDINMGCPVPKVAIKNEAGSALMKNPTLVREIVSRVVKAVNVPVTVKIRSGWDSNSINAVEIAKICEECGASLVAVHGRTRAQGYSGTSDCSIIKKVKENVSIKVVGNGDVNSPETFKKMLDETGCDGVMIGRALMGNPFLIKQISDYLTTGSYEKNISNQDKINMIKKHYNLLKKYKTEYVALLEIRSHIMWYLKGMPENKEMKMKICSCKTDKELLDTINEYEKNCCN